jgi:hypothetical protein
MPIQTRNTALQGEAVRLYCSFDRDGVPSDPIEPPSVEVVDASWNLESSSSTSQSSGETVSEESSSSSTGHSPATFGPFLAEREVVGLWYADFVIPDDQALGPLYDIWRFRWEQGGRTIEKINEFVVHSKDEFITLGSLPQPSSRENAPDMSLLSHTGSYLFHQLNNLFLYEAQHIPIYWEQALRTADKRLVNLAWQNWQDSPRPLVRLNQRLVHAGWTADYNGLIRFDRDLAPEDNIYATYHFRYFGDRELLDFLNAGLYAMNATPPSSENYGSIGTAPFPWRAGILLYAALTGMQRLIFGLNFQERSLIVGENLDEAHRRIDNFKELYKQYYDLWKEFAKNIKTLRLPGIAMVVQPEYTLPGGRCMSGDTYIICRLNGVEQLLTIREAYTQHSLGIPVEAVSMVNGAPDFANVKHIWKSGIKPTYLLKCDKNEVRLTAEHLVYVSSKGTYLQTSELRAGDVLLTYHKGKLTEHRLERSPFFFATEQVYDAEVPSAGNLIGNRIVMHNSRWFRYLYKASG